jgi:hypothetical protein
MGIHPKIVSERLGQSSIGITLDISSRTGFDVELFTDRRLMTERRELDSNERQILETILRQWSAPGVEELQLQVPGTVVVGGLPTLLDLEMDKSLPSASLKDGPVQTRAIVVGSDDAPEGEILIWVRDGYLSGLEYAWVTNEPPAGFPSASRVRVT